MKTDQNQNIESVLICNNQVESLLPDKPDRLEVLKQIDHIKSLEVQQRQLRIYIHNNDTFNYFKNLFYAVNGREIKDSQPVFYYDIPIILFEWLTKFSLKDLINQIALYLGYLRHVSMSDKVFYRHFYDSPIYNRINQAYNAIDNSKLIMKDLFEYRYFIKKHLRHESKEVILNTVKYWKLSEKYLKQLPIDPMLCLNPIKGSEWNKIYKDFDFNYKVYLSFKGYKNIRENRFGIISRGSDDEYSEKYLDLWKYFYVNKSISKKVINNVYGINLTSTHYFENDKGLCDVCGDSIIGLVIDFGEVEESKPLCVECYLWEYFE